MNGPDHFRKAEHLLVAADDMYERHDRERAEFTQRRAKVHAILALAAAQIEDMESTELRPGWAKIVDGSAP